MQGDTLWSSIDYRPLAQRVVFAILSILIGSSLSTAQQPSTARPESRLWPDVAPNETSQLEPEQNTTKPGDHGVADKSVIRLGHVSNPTIQFYPAPQANAAGTTVVVFPGGGYNILAMDLEGTEVCEWLNSIGVHAVLVKYRVPRRPDREKQDAPLQDAQRAIGLVRQKADERKIHPQRIGVLGFSAGGHLAACASLHDEQRTYEPVDDADRVSSRPDFSILIYPAYLLDDEKKNLAKELKVTSETPPTFLVMAQDDPVDVRNVLVYSAALHEHKVPFELHVFPKGGHGYGLRATGMPVAGWPRLVEAWLRQSSLLE